jgi:hypothetical protein
MERTWTALYLSITIVLLAVLYDQLTKRIPSRLRADEAPKSAFGLVRVDELSSHASAHGVEYVYKFNDQIWTCTKLGL